MAVSSLLLLFLLVGARATWVQDRPVLETRDGNLVIASARDRNISLQTFGASSVNINDINLVQVSRDAQEAAITVKAWKSQLMGALVSNVNQLSTDMTAVQQRISGMDFTGNGTNIPYGPPNSRGRPTEDGTFIGGRFSVRRLEQRVRTLEFTLRAVRANLRMNGCDRSPCKNGGTCINAYAGYQCLCPPNWEGLHCSIDVNECENFAGTDLGCQHGATCTNLPGSYRCSCAKGWHGIHCNTKLSSCEAQDSLELCGHGTCVPTPNNEYTCICNQGWTTDGSSPSCRVDVNECAGKHAACSMSPLVPCFNTDGGYNCGACPPGYTGNGHYCHDVNECLVDNGGCSTTPRVECINSIGSWSCGLCPPGYQGDGVTCTYVGACRVNNGGCNQLATCVESAGYVQCNCQPGYHGTGIGPQGCLPGATIGSACDINPCVHGTCQPNGGGFICRCFPGFSGTTCESAAHPCSPNPCQNGGTCRSSDSRTFTCNCTASFTGTKCETQRQSCSALYKTPSGTLEYPSNGMLYEPGLNCAFVILTNTSLVLNITFTRFDFEKSKNCRFDFLQIHDGQNAGAHQKGRYCGTQKPLGGSFTTTHNAVYFWLRTDNSDARRGFAIRWESVLPACGGHLTGDHGRIASPGSPGQYPHNRDCEWFVDVKPGKRIQFHFYSVMIEEHPTCDNDYLEINETAGNREIQLGLYCNHTYPPPLLTSGSFAKIFFHSDGDGSDAGFQISYSAVEGSPGCGGTFTSDHGVISSPGYPNNYSPYMNCDWKIQLPIGERIRITWVAMDIEKQRRCRWDAVEVFSGPDTDSPVVGRYCGQKLPESRVIDSNVALIVFTSDFSGQRTGFQLKYEVMCGGEYRDPTGVLRSPYYPQNYPARRRCTYQIIQPPGKGIILRIVDMEIEAPYSRTCYFDGLVIYDGDSENSTRLDTLCGQPGDIPAEPYTSTNNYMYLSFYTDGSGHNRGFLANYTTVDHRCGGLLKEPTGIIRSHLVGELYEANEECTWTLKAPRGYIVQLSFTSFHLEENPGCTRDYVLVRDTSMNDQEIGRFCGSKLPSPRNSQGEVMTVKFRSDYSVSHEGFIAHYIFVDASKICGGNFFSTTGVITTPNYPSPYPPNKECVWIITAPQKRIINLQVNQFHLEKLGDCRHDWLEIRNGGSEQSPLVGRYCGKEIPASIKSLTHELYLKFVSDSSRHMGGFSIAWDTSTHGCGGILNGMRGEIISPGYPQPYSSFTNCLWTIAVSEGSRVNLVFIDFDLEDHDRCVHDYVEVSNGLDERRRGGKRYCGANHPSYITMESNHVTIRFRSDYRTNGRGFHIRYETLCQNTVRGFNGVIESPNFPNKYPNSANCTWIIEAPKGNKINITFSNFELESRSWSNNCTFDYVEIEGGEDNVPSWDLGTYCGTEIPGPVSSTTNQVFVHFSSDKYYTHEGFRLEWIVVGCGGILRHPVGDIHSPNYPNSYPHNIECEWLIEVDSIHSVEITFLDISTEKTISCEYDKVELYAGEDATAPKIGELCHSDGPAKFTSPTNRLFVKFRSDFSGAGRGFNAQYKSVELQCGGTFQASQGFIHSANYPKNYPHNQNCEWLVSVDKNHLVNLTFVELDIEGTPNCTDDYVKVFDGSTRNDLLLGTFCRNTVPPPIVSTGNTILVVMRSDSIVTAKGFEAKFTKACGARIVTDGTGVLETNTLLHLHKYELNCTWTILAKDPADHVTLHFNYMDLSSDVWMGDASCEDYYVQVYEGDGIDGASRGKWCTNKAPPAIISNGYALTVHLYARYANVDDKFGATYSVLDSSCGGEYLSASGAFSTPNYPQNYMANATCVWLLMTSPGNRISLTFSDFALEPSDNCDADYLEIREESGIGNLLKIACRTAPEPIESSKKLWIKFRSDAVGTAKGFLAEYTFLHGNELTGLNGEITSPLYPQQWRKTDLITWRITVGFGEAVRVEFDVVGMERFYGECLSRVMVYDGYDDKASVLATVCGVVPPENPIVSSSNVIFIEYSSDWVREGNVFRLHWYQVPRELSVDNSVTQVSECQVEYDLSSVENNSLTIKTPGFPEGYADMLDCTWVVKTIPGFHLLVLFDTVDVEETRGCVNDYASLYEGNGLANTLDESQLITKVCHSNATHQLFKANVATIKFHSDYLINGTGVRAHVWRDCGGILSGPDGVINFNDTKNMFAWRNPTFMCEWNITVRQGKTIEVKFSNFRIDNAVPVGCKDNYVMLKNGAGPASPLLGAGRYCGKRGPTTKLETTGNKLYVKVNGNGAKINFKLKYREVGMNCGGFYRVGETENQLQLSSPNYPNIPPPFSECFWKFMAPAGGRLSLHFVQRFDLFNSANCTKEYVEVRDGGTEHSILIGRYCGDEPPGTLTTMGNMLYVHFYSELHDPKNGFKAHVTTGVCGGIVRGKTGVVRSPNYPRSYPINQDCAWWIEGPRDHTLKLQFHDIYLPSLRACNLGDYVRVGEKFPMNGTVHPFGTYCGSRKPEILETNANEALVSFHSGNRTRLNFRGFLLNYTASKESCGGELFGISGEFKTPNYPNPTRQSRYCQWRITTPVGTHVVMEIIDMDIEENGGDVYFLVANDFFTKSINKVVQSAPYPKKYFSTSRYMSVQFYSSEGLRRLRARYTAVSPPPCGGPLDDVAGSLLPPVSPYNASSFFCQWNLKAPASMMNAQNITRTTLTITVSGIFGESSPSTICNTRSKYISMHDGQHKLGYLCGNLTGKTYTMRSPAPFNTIDIVNGSHTKPIQFDVKYEWKACGGILLGPKHTIRSPDNVAYPKSCVWHAKFEDPGAVIVLTFKRMNFQDCDDGYITVRNGGPLSPKVGKYCGTLLPHNITSSSNEMWIEYSAVRAPGDFEIKLDTMGGSCGGSISGANREIVSPGFPNNYPNNAECTWEIHVELGHSIGISFVDRFNLETSEGCANDFVQLFDWIYDERGIAGWQEHPKLCGRETPSVHNSSSNRMKVLFRTNNAIQGDGFKVVWDEFCGGIFEASRHPQFIESPNYPDNYPDKKVCNYTINGPAGKKIWVEFVDFALESSYKKRCRWDNITVTYDSDSERSDVFCGHKLPPMISGEDSINIMFKTDPYRTERGFRFKYFINECGGDVTEPTEIGPPVMNNGEYFGELNCTWIIKAPEGMSVTLRFEKFELERSHGCMFDRVIIAEGISAAGPRLAVICGNTTDPFPVASVGNVMTVMFLSDSSHHYGGMKAMVIFTTSVQNGCGGKIELTNSKPFRTQTGALYDNFEDCQWSISAPTGQVIKLQINSMDLKYKVNSTAKGCNGDYLEVRDGAGAFSDLIGRYCGNEPPQAAVESTLNTLWIRFYTDGSEIGAGVTATLSAVDSPCGRNYGDVTNHTEMVQSPGYPGDYPAGIRCRWIFSSEEMWQLRLHFVELNMESTTDCTSGDHIEISDKPAQYISQDFGESFVYDGMHLGRRYGSYAAVPKYSYCGSVVAHDHYSSSSEVHVLLKSTTKNLPKPRKFKFEVENSKCNRNYTAEQGRIVHRGFDDCWTTITALPNQTISVYFIDFRMYDWQSNCTKAFLKVYQGDFKAPNPKTLCGMRDPVPIFSIGNKLSFHAKGSTSRYSGLNMYDMLYTTTDKGRGCGGRIFNLDGVFTSPMYPMNYRNDSVCDWEVSVPRTHQVALSFKLFDIGASEICDTDYVQVTEQNVDAPRIETYCPGQTPAIFKAKSNVVKVRYVSSVNNGGTGWVIHFRAIHNSDNQHSTDLRWYY